MDRCVYVEMRFKDLFWKPIENHTRIGTENYKRIYKKILITSKFLEKGEASTWVEKLDPLAICGWSFDRKRQSFIFHKCIIVPQDGVERGRAQQAIRLTLYGGSFWASLLYSWESDVRIQWRGDLYGTLPKLFYPTLHKDNWYTFAIKATDNLTAGR